MSPTVTAAVIAASVGVLTLIGTLAAQYFGRRATSRDTQLALAEQRKQLDRTLGEQRSRTLDERFATAAEQLGNDKPAIRLAGVYAMAGLTGTEFSGGEVDFSNAYFSGGKVNFRGTIYSGGMVDFSRAIDWSFPPTFSWADWTDKPPPGLKLSTMQEDAEYHQRPGA